MCTAASSAVTARCSVTATRSTTATCGPAPDPTSPSDTAISRTTAPPTPAVVLDDRTAAGVGGAVILDIAVSDGDVGSGAGPHVAVVDLVAVTEHRAVTADDAAVHMATHRDRSVAVGGGLAATQD